MISVLLPLAVTLGIFQTVEFYIILAVIAAAIVAFSARPASRGPVVEHLLAGTLQAGDGDVDAACAQPSIELAVDDRGTVTLTRRGLEGLTMSGAVSLAVTVKGFDITVNERLSPGYSNDRPCEAAVFALGFMGPERYHIHYRSEAISRMAALTFHVRPGMRVVKELTR